MNAPIVFVLLIGIGAPLLFFGVRLLAMRLSCLIVQEKPPAIGWGLVILLVTWAISIVVHGAATVLTMIILDIGRRRGFDRGAVVMYVNIMLTPVDMFMWAGWYRLMMPIPYSKGILVWVLEMVMLAAFIGVIFGGLAMFA